MSVKHEHMSNTVTRSQIKIPILHMIVLNRDEDD